MSWKSDCTSAHHSNSWKLNAYSSKVGQKNSKQTRLQKIMSPKFQFNSCQTESWTYWMTKRDKNLQNSSADFFGVASNWKLNKVWGRGLRSWQGRRADADSGSFQPAGPTLAHFTPDLQHFPRILQQIFCGLRQPSRRGSSYCTSSGGR